MEAIQGIGETAVGEFTDDDLDFISGTRDKFVGKLQERYGLAKEDAQRRADEWVTAQAEQGKH